MTANPNIDQTWLALHLTYGLVPLLAGLDKFFNVLSNRESYLVPAAHSIGRSAEAEAEKR